MVSIEKIMLKMFRAFISVKLKIRGSLKDPLIAIANIEFYYLIIKVIFFVP